MNMNTLAFLFPGQGSQYVGMGWRWHRQYAVVRQTFEEASERLGFDLARLCREGDKQQLTETANAQPAILTVSVAAFRVYMEEIGLRPAWMAGHSLGEITALTCAGAIPFPDAVALVRLRGALMQEAVALGGGAMAAVNGVPAGRVEQVCLEVSRNDCQVVISNYNTPGQTVISGHREAVEGAGQRLKQAGAALIPLQVSAPFHSPLMQQAAEQFHQAIRQFTFSPLNYPVISNVTAGLYPGEGEIADLLARQITSPVQWTASMHALKALGMELAVELGPQAVLRNLLKRIEPGVRGFAYEQAEEAQELADVLWLETTEPRSMRGEHSVVSRCLAVAVCTRNHGANEAEYEERVIGPYQDVKRMHEALEQSGALPDLTQMQEALRMLRSVFEAKRTPEEERRQRFRQILRETNTEASLSGFVQGLLEQKEEAVIGEAY